MSVLAHPWPTTLGAQNAGIAPVEIGRSGTVRWSVELPARTAQQIVAASDGRWVIGGAAFIACGDRRGVAWRRDESSTPVLLDDKGGAAVARWDKALAVLDLDRGAERWTIAGGFIDIGLAPDGAIAATEARGRACWLVLAEPDGAVRWSRPVGVPVGAPLAWGGLVIDAARNQVSAFAAAGELAWTASPAGFGAPAKASNHVFTTPPFALDDRRIAIGANAYDWRGYLIVEPAAAVAAPWRLPQGGLVIDERPVAVRRAPGRALALVTRWMFHACITAIDGSEVRHVAFPAAPYGYAVDPSGAIAVGYTLDVDYYDRYRWHDEGRALRGRCGVTVLEPDGRQRWTWDAPGPLSGFAIGADGAVLTTSEGRLWALG